MPMLELPMMPALGKSLNKNQCLLSTIASDLAALDSSYPNVKLVDQSFLAFGVQPKGDEPSAEELAIVNSHNNVFQLKAGKETWFVVIGLIDLFAIKDKGKKWQSRTSWKHFVFHQKKYALYPFNLFCMSQYMFYYDHFGNNTQTPSTFDGAVGQSWPACFEKGGVHDETFSPASFKHHAETTKIHMAVRNQDRICSLMQTCDAMLRQDDVRQNLVDCCGGSDVKNCNL